MKTISMDEFSQSLEEHKQLLKMLGYRLDVINGSLPLHEDIKIYKEDKIVGTLTHKDKNMYWLKEKGEILANENINNMRFSQVPKYNKKPVFHIIMRDGKFNCECYNIFNKNYIAIENKKFKIKKFKNGIRIEIKKYKTTEEFIVQYPNRIDNNEEYTEKINKIFGYDIISKIESYYDKKKVKIRK